jgi:hypothetical protein
MVRLYEIRRRRPMGTESMGRRKLRTRARAGKLCRYLKRRFGIETELHPWRIRR